LGEAGKDAIAFWVKCNTDCIDRVQGFDDAIAFLDLQFHQIRDRILSFSISSD
jgi:ABC-type sugar transport system substrate-binding protein